MAKRDELLFCSHLVRIGVRLTRYIRIYGLPLRIFIGDGVMPLTHNIRSWNLEIRQPYSIFVILFIETVINDFETNTHLAR